MRHALLAFTLACFSLGAAAQTPGSDEYVKDGKPAEAPSDLSTVHIGPGLGLEYGGIGLGLSFLPEQHVRLLVGGGFALAGFGYNVGVEGRILPRSKVCPYVEGLYGYNGVIVVMNASQFNKIYYGPSFGTGIELHKRRKTRFWRFGFTIPFRPSAFYDDWDALKTNPNVKVQQEPMPFTITAGIHWAI